MQVGVFIRGWGRG